MPAVVQAPIIRGKPTKVGPRTFRKEILRTGYVPHPEHARFFTRPELEKYAEHFHSGAYDQVSVMLTDEANRHTDDPDRWRGEVVGMDLNGDRLFATMNLSDEGARLVEDNPKLGVSVRIREEPDGYAMPRKWPAIEHVAATLHPCVDGMSGWEKVSDLSASFGSSVVDLTGSSYGRLEEQRRDRAALLDAWAQSLGEAPTGQPVELSTMTTNPTRAWALQQWEKEYGR